MLVQTESIGIERFMPCHALLAMLCCRLCDMKMPDALSEASNDVCKVIDYCLDKCDKHDVERCVSSALGSWVYCFHLF